LVVGRWSLAFGLLVVGLGHWSLVFEELVKAKRGVSIKNMFLFKNAKIEHAPPPLFKGSYSPSGDTSFRGPDFSVRVDRRRAIPNF
jgi:hypothetical protein